MIPIYFVSFSSKSGCCPCNNIYFGAVPEQKFVTFRQNKKLSTYKRSIEAMTVIEKYFESGFGACVDVFVAPVPRILFSLPDKFRVSSSFSRLSLFFRRSSKHYFSPLGVQRPLTATRLLFQPRGTTSPSAL